MSYILDALKKAEQERKRGKAPDFMAVHEDRDDKPGKRSWLYAVLVLLAAAAGSAGWFLGADKNTSLPAKPQQPAQVALNSPEQSQPTTPSTPAESPAPAPVAKIAETNTPARELTTQAEKPETAGRQEVKTSRGDKDIKKAKASLPDSRRPSETAPETPQPTGIKKAVPGNRIYSISELPDEIRQGLPALSISTHIYSPEKSERLASINGNIGREGQEIISGITLESITVEGAILRYQGYKFRVDLK